MKLLEQACNELKGSHNFKKILEMVLAVGNYLNGDSFRGAAQGFKLGALLKLMDIKSHNNKTTLLHFVVAELMRIDEKVWLCTHVHVCNFVDGVISCALVIGFFIQIIIYNIFIYQ